MCVFFLTKENLLYEWCRMLPSMILILRESVFGLKARPLRRRLTLNGAPLRTTRALEPLNPSVRCRDRFSDISKLTFCNLNSAREREVLFKGIAFLLIFFQYQILPSICVSGKSDSVFVRHSVLL